MLIVGVLLIPLFLISLYIIFKFTWGKEGKGERGEEILNKSNRVTVPILPIGWLLLEISHSIFDISYSLYRDSLWVLVLINFIVHGLAIYFYKNNKHQANE